MADYSRGATYGLLLAIAACALFSTLGTWQLSRGTQKERQLAAFAGALDAPPASLAASVDADAEPPRRVRGSGRYDAAATVLLDNQVLDGRAGVHVLTLFRPDGARRAVLVDRGWLALPPDRRVPAIGAPAADALEIAGLLAVAPSAGLKLGQLDIERGALLPRLELPAVAQAFGVELYDGVLLLDPSAPHGFARRWQALPNTLPPERHRAYAVQWFALALASIITFGVLTWRDRKKS